LPQIPRSRLRADHLAQTWLKLNPCGEQYRKHNIEKGKKTGIRNLLDSPPRKIKNLVDPDKSG